MTSSDGSTLTGERADLLVALGKARHWIRFTTRDLTDEQARQRTTVSELTIGGLVKHVTGVERNWARFIVHGPSAAPDFANLSEADYQRWKDGFRLLPEETLAGVLADYEQAAKETDDLVATYPDLDADTRCRPPRGTRPVSAGPRGARCCTSPPRPPSTPATPTSSASRLTGPRPWADPGCVVSRATDRASPPWPGPSARAGDR